MIVTHHDETRVFRETLWKTNLFSVQIKKIFILYHSKKFKEFVSIRRFVAFLFCFQYVELSATSAKKNHVLKLLRTT